jgi:choline-sulfatase
MLDALRASRFIYAMEREPRPFFLAYSCYEPHRPLACPRPFAGRYAPDQMPLPATRRAADGPALLRARPDHQLQPAADFSDADLRVMWAAYFASVSYVDHLVGTLLAALLDTDQFGNTLFIFTSDHGELLGSHGLLWKGSMLYEELVNVPLLIRPPHAVRGSAGHGRESSRVVSHVDVAATILDWCGAAPPGPLDGASLRALVEGRDAPVHDGVALEYYAHTTRHAPTPLRGWVTEDWKYVEDQQGPAELYDLRRDPGETRNLVGGGGGAEAEAALASAQAALRAWLARSEDPWPEVRTPPIATGESSDE